MSERVGLFDDKLIKPPQKSVTLYGAVTNTTMYPDWLADWLYGNELLQIIFAFALAMTLASWSWGIIIFFIGLVVWEILYYVSVKGTKPYYFFEVRLAIVAASVLGWLVGRELTGKDADRLDPFLGRPAKKIPEPPDEN